MDQRAWELDGVENRRRSVALVRPAGVLLAVALSAIVLLSCGPSEVTESVPWTDAAIGADGRALTVMYGNTCTGRDRLSVKETKTVVEIRVLSRDVRAKHHCPAIGVRQEALHTQLRHPGGDRQIIHGPVT